MPEPSVPAAPSKQTRGATPSGPRRAMERLGLLRPIDLALHLPLRYEDETRLTPLREARSGEVVQVEGVVRLSRIENQRRRQLLVSLQDDEGQSLQLRFLHFYPSHQKTLAEGRRVRVRGELRGGLFGREMVHPSFKAVDEDTPLAQVLTPVYPAGAGLPQAYLRKAIEAALPKAPLQELLPAGVVPAGLPPLREALQLLHHPPANVPLQALQEHSHPAWQRLKFEELLAQQLSQLQSKALRAQHRAPQLRSGPLTEQLLSVLPFQLTNAQQRVAEEIAADLAQAQPAHRLLQGDVGSGKT
ncbi:MAG: ATP-dependent DNA helicase RecG, partial [Burkholderiales bacterium]